MDGRTCVGSKGLPDLQLSELAQPGPGSYALTHRFSALLMKKYEGSVAFTATVPRYYTGINHYLLICNVWLAQILNTRLGTKSIIT
jgi:hypothetical protein